LAAHLSKALFSPKPYLCGILRVAANSNTSLSSLLVSEGQRCGAELAIFPLPERLKDREWWQVWIDGVPLNCAHHHGQQGGQAHRYGGENSDLSAHGVAHTALPCPKNCRCPADVPEYAIFLKVVTSRFMFPSSNRWTMLMTHYDPSLWTRGAGAALMTLLRARPGSMCSRRA